MPADRTILHCDINGFFASVEALYHPEAAGKPMAVGGDPKQRKGVILAKNELAKKFGVSTGESIWAAKRKCPGLIVLPAHHDLYEQYSQKVNALYSEFTNRVEPFGIDESWLDVSASAALFGGGKTIADKIRREVRERFGFTISVGVSFNKVFAKLGSDYKKPDATTVFDRASVEKLVHPLPAADMLFVGRATAAALAKMRIKTIGDLARASESAVRAKLGKAGAELVRFARGEDDSPVAFYGEEDEAKSIGNSLTFWRDLRGEEDFRLGYCKVAEKLSARMKDAKLKGRVLSITVKFADFTYITRQKILEAPTNSYRELVGGAVSLTAASCGFGRPARMLGITVSDLLGESDAFVQGDLFAAAKKSPDAENVLFNLRKRFGSSSIKFGNMLDSDL